MTWRKNECHQPTRCNQCRSKYNVEYSRTADEYLCEECLPFAIEQIEKDASVTISASR